MALLTSKSVAERVRQLELPLSRHGVDPYGATQDELARMFTLLELPLPALLPRAA